MSPDPQQPDDRELEAFLRGEHAASRAWRQRADASAEPPAALDAAVLDFARRSQQPKVARWRRLQRPLALAAVLVLSLSVLMRMPVDVSVPVPSKRVKAVLVEQEASAFPDQNTAEALQRVPGIPVPAEPAAVSEEKTKQAETRQSEARQRAAAVAMKESEERAAKASSLPSPAARAAARMAAESRDTMADAALAEHAETPHNIRGAAPTALPQVATVPPAVAQLSPSPVFAMAAAPAPAALAAPPPAAPPAGGIEAIEASDIASFPKSEPGLAAKPSSEQAFTATRFKRAAAPSAAPAPAAPAPSSIAQAEPMQELVVIGSRASLQSAISRKKSAAAKGAWSAPEFMGLKLGVATREQVRKRFGTPEARAVTEPWPDADASNSRQIDVYPRIPGAEGHVEFHYERVSGRLMSVRQQLEYLRTSSEQLADLEWTDDPLIRTGIGDPCAASGLTGEGPPYWWLYPAQGAYLALPVAGRVELIVYEAECAVPAGPLAK